MYKWVKFVHVIGFLVWSGSLIACLALLRRHMSAAGDTRDLLTDLERKFALSMDIGATVAIAAGVYLAVSKEAFGGQFNWFNVKGPDGKSMGVWLHMKSLFVLFLIGLHGFTRVKVGKFRKKESSSLPSFVMPASLLLLIIIVFLATVKPMSGM